MLRSSPIVFSALLLSPALAGCATSSKLAVEYRPAEAAGSVAVKGSFLARGQAQLAAGIPSLAIESFRSEIRKSPDNGNAYNGLAIAYDRIGRTDLAQRYFEIAVAKTPRDRRFRDNLVRLFERTGRAHMAENLLSSGVGLALTPTPSLENTLAVQMAADVTVDDDSRAQADEKPIVEETVLPPVLVEGKFQIADAADVGLGQKIVDHQAKSGIENLDPVAEYLDNKSILDIATVSSQSNLTQVKLVPGAKLNLAPKLPDPERSPIRQSDPMIVARVEDRNDRMRIDRISLGEVKITTLANVEQGQISVSDFDIFGRRLASWLPQAIAIETGSAERKDVHDATMLGAVERAQIEQAFTFLDSENEQVKLPELDLVEYVYFPDASAGSV